MATPKRPRSSSPSPHSKLACLPSSSLEESRVWCTLPPTCHTHPTSVGSSAELEVHYARYHAHVCHEEGCMCVFPDARLLELHQTECHDPIAALRKERGEKIFACHIPTCPRLFSTPKTRRLHLIQTHHYPKEYFFAVTNKGVGGLLRRWGEGASLVRGVWCAREGVEGVGVGVGEGEGEEGVGGVHSSVHTPTPPHPQDTHTSPLIEPPSSSSFSDSDPNRTPPPPPTNSTANATEEEDLATTMSALTLVPSAVRFGRGGGGGGYASVSSRGGGYTSTGGGYISHSIRGGESGESTSSRGRGGGEGGGGGDRVNMRVGMGDGREGRGMRGIPGGRRGMIFGSGRGRGRGG